MSYTIITDSNDKVLYVSQHVDAVAYKYTQDPYNKMYTIEDEHIPQDLAMWRYEHTMYSELSGLFEDGTRLIQELDNVREIRDIELSKTDWITIKHMETKQDLPEGYAVYREWLRDLPETYDTKKVLVSPITAVTGSWMNPKIIEELQPWSYIQDLSGTDDEFIPPLISRDNISIPVSAFDDVHEEVVLTNTESLLTCISASLTAVHEPSGSQSSVVVHNNTVSFEYDDDESVDMYTRTWDLSG